MDAIALSLNTTGWDKAIKRVADRYPQAVRRALTRAGSSARVVMVREIAKDLGIKQGDVQPAVAQPQIVVQQDFVSARIVATGARIGLYKFRARQTKTGVTARLPGGAGMYPGAFIATMASGHVGVFKRRGQTRLPIVELFGPSVPKVFEKYIPMGLARGREQLAKNLVSEFRFVLGKGAAA